MRTVSFLLVILLCACHAKNTIKQEEPITTKDSTNNLDSIYRTYHIPLLAPHPINDSVKLIKYAEPILFSIYGKEQIESEKPYKVSLVNGVWYMDGSLHEEKEGTFHIEIKASDRKILNIIHYK